MSAHSPDLEITWEKPDTGYRTANQEVFNVQSYLLDVDNGTFQFVIVGNSDLTTATLYDFEDYFGTRTFKLAACKNIDGSRPGPFSDPVQFTVEYYNQPSDLQLSQDENTVILNWQNPDFGYLRNGDTFTPNFKIQRRNHYPYPGTSAPDGTSITEFNYTDNAFGNTEYQDAVDFIDAFGSTYDYRIAAVNPTTGKVYAYTDYQSILVQQFNVPENLQVFYGTDGNNALLTWSNPAYTEIIESFSISRTNPAGHPSGSSQVFTFNDDGSATYYVDENVGLYAGTYGYQVAACLSEDGFDPITFTFPVVTKYIYDNTPPGEFLPKVYFDTTYDITKYYGSYILEPHLLVNASTSGTGTINLDWIDELDNSFTETNEQNINYNNDNFDLYLNGKSRARNANSTTFDWTAELDPDLTYEIGTGSGVVELELPVKFQPTLLSVESDTNNTVNWLRITNAQDDAVHYGYWLQFYPEGDVEAFDQYLTVDSGDSGTASYVFYGHGTAGHNWTYTVYGASNDTFSSLYITKPSNTITSDNVTEPPVAPTANCNSSRTTSTAVLTWSASGGATSYKLHVQSVFGMSVVYNDFNVGNVTSYEVSIDPGDYSNEYTYTFKVKASNSEGDSAYSNSITFAIAPAAPTSVTSPSQTSSSVLVDWADVTGVAAYQAQRALTSDFASPTTISDIASSQVNFTSLTTGTTYYFRVRCQVNTGACGTIYSDWSSTLEQATS